MMATLMNQDKSKLLLSDLKVASDFWSRTKGLLGTKTLAEGQGLWIHQCNSIHTFFMKYSIDCIFVDKNMQIKAIKKDIQPGRMTLPIWSASSVIEVRAGLVDQLQISEGDHLYVGT